MAFLTVGSAEVVDRVVRPNFWRHVIVEGVPQEDHISLLDLGTLISIVLEVNVGGGVKGNSEVVSNILPVVDEPASDTTV